MTDTPPPDRTADLEARIAELERRNWRATMDEGRSGIETAFWAALTMRYSIVNRSCAISEQRAPTWTVSGNVSGSLKRQCVEARMGPTPSFVSGSARPIASRNAMRALSK